MNGGIVGKEKIQWAQERVDKWAADAARKDGAATVITSVMATLRSTSTSSGTSTSETMGTLSIVFESTSLPEFLSSTERRVWFDRMGMLKGAKESEADGTHVGMHIADAKFNAAGSQVGMRLHVTSDFYNPESNGFSDFNWDVEGPKRLESVLEKADAAITWYNAQVSSYNRAVRDFEKARDAVIPDMMWLKRKD